MYFNEKEDTNIDKEFKKNKKHDFENSKKIFTIIGLILLFLIIIIVVVLFLKNRTTYYLNLNGSTNINIYEGVEFTDPGYYAYDNHRNDLTNSVIVSGNVDTDTVGTYTITYSLKNRVAQRVVNVIASQSQFTKIILEGDTIMTVPVGSEYIEPGYYYSDLKVGDMRDKVVVNGKVDTTKPGRYRITYSVVNSDDVTITTERIIIVE